jgi:hypothetical protein
MSEHAPLAFTDSHGTWLEWLAGAQAAGLAFVP